MTVYVDDAIWPLGRMMMCHMMSDGGVDELHEMASKLGLKRQWFQGDHYDISKGKRYEAIALGAVPKTSKFLVALRRAQRG